MKILYALLLACLGLPAFAAAPTTPSSNLSLNAIDGTYFNLGWTSGNGARRIIICKAGSPVTFVPENGIDYSENNEFGLGQQVLPGEYVIYDHFSSSFFLTGLTPSTTYFFRIFEYNGTGASIEYLVSAFLSGSATTSTIPTVQTSAVLFSGITTNSVNVQWTSGNGSRRLLVVRENAPVNADPVNSQPYAVNAQFGAGATTGAGNFTVYNSSGSGVTVTNLRPGTTYHFAFYEFNGINQPQYLKPAFTTSMTTRSVPTVAPTNLVITKTDGKELFLAWTNGNGQRRIVVAKKGSSITSAPVDGTDYDANLQFGAGQQLGSGEYVVYDGTFNSTNITGLEPATVYFFRIFEYDGTGSGTAYLTSSFAAVNGSTAIRPVTGVSAVSAINITSHSLSLQFTPGNGRGRLIIGRKNAPVNVSPSDFTTYSDNADFGAGQDLGNGNFVLNSTINPFSQVNTLEPNTTYHFAFFEFNGYNQPLYSTSPVVFSATTLFALPVTLTGFEATPLGNQVKLQWATSGEINSSHYDVERSEDGIHFTKLATVTAAGNSQMTTTYSWADARPLAGRSAYRLKMVDLDGKHSYSPVRLVLINPSAMVQLLNNPAGQSLEFLVSSGTGTRGSWSIVNTVGQVIKRGHLDIGKNSFPLENMPAGTYWLRINSGSFSRTLPFVHH